MKTSPSAKKSLLGVSKEPMMNFGAALQKMVNGKFVRRLDWEDPEVVIGFQDNRLMIYKTEDEKFHPLIVSVGDVTGTDWVIRIG